LIYLLEKRREQYGELKVAIVTSGSKETFKELIEVRPPNHEDTRPHNMICLVSSKRGGAEK